MKKLITCFLFLGCMAVQAQRLNTAEAEAFYNKAMPVIKPLYKTQVLKSAAALRNKSINADSLKTAFKNTPELGNLADGDIMALCFLVMMEAAKSAQEDLKSIMANVKIINKRKEKMRSQEESLRLQKTPVPDVKRQIDSLKNQTDKLSDVDSEEQTKLRLMTDRYEKSQQAMANIMTKIRDTQDTIINNLK